MKKQSKQEEFFFSSENLVIWRPTGVLDADGIMRFIQFLNKESENRDPHFFRFIDLTQIAGLNIRYQELAPIASQRKTYSTKELKRKVKMGFLVRDPLTYGMARMYQSLVDNTNFDIQIFENRQELAMFFGESENSIQ